MSSYFSNLLTQTTDRVNSIRQNIFTSEADGDTEDDTHVCRVLRAYYQEKGRQLPGWLPPDPKAPAPIQPVYANNNVGAGYGGYGQQGGGGGGGGGATGLSSLWEQPSGGGGAPQPAAQSLRQGRGGGRTAKLGSAARDPFNRMETRSAEPSLQTRPPPTQRGGSYQTFSVERSDSVPSTGVGSASDKLKARLWGSGSRSASPAMAGGPSPPAASPSPSYQSESSSSGGYEGRYSPGSQGGGYAPPPGGRQRPMGLPGGPRGGLPSGPRMR